MKTYKHVLALWTVATFMVGCGRNAAQDMVIQTGLDLTQKSISVSFVYREDVDRRGYNVTFDPKENDFILGQMEKIGGRLCRDGIEKSNGCHYRSTKNYGIFIKKVSETQYSILVT